MQLYDIKTYIIRYTSTFTKPKNNITAILYNYSLYDNNKLFRKQYIYNSEIVYVNCIEIGLLLSLFQNAKEDRPPCVQSTPLSPSLTWHRPKMCRQYIRGPVSRLVTLQQAARYYAGSEGSLSPHALYHSSLHLVVSSIVVLPAADKMPTSDRNPTINCMGLAVGGRHGVTTQIIGHNIQWW